MTGPAMTTEDAVGLLERHPDFRVVRRMTELPRLASLPEGARKAVGLDVEATGANPAVDEIIELGMVAFAYTPDGDVLGILDEYSAFQQPSVPISAEITALTGIDDAMVAGHAIDAAEVTAFIEGADLIVAHNAAYDRRMVERRWPGFVSKCWACTMSEIDWKSEGYEGMKLGLLLLQRGLFHEGHRATFDCHAMIALLAGRMPRSGRTGMSLLLECARRTRVRISAVGTPFAAKETLKERGYRWTGEERQPHKAWQKDVVLEEADPEIEFLRTSIYRGRGSPMVSKVTAFERFSDRA